MLGTLSKTPNEKPCNTIDTLIGARTELTGDVVFTGGLRIDGKLKGNITAQGDGNSTLVLSENAVVEGNVTVPYVISNGTIKGTLRAAERLELQPKAEVIGDVHYRVMEMALGAAVNGKLVREPGAGKERAPVMRFKSVASGAEPEGDNKSG